MKSTKHLATPFALCLALATPFVLGACSKPEEPAVPPAGETAPAETPPAEIPPTTDPAAPPATDPAATPPAVDPAAPPPAETPPAEGTKPPAT
ncbi:MAG: hypothetical protein ABW178_08095 [Pseudoxanthomonas sp.]